MSMTLNEWKERLAPLIFGDRVVPTDMREAVLDTCL